MSDLLKRIDDVSLEDLFAVNQVLRDCKAEIINLKYELDVLNENGAGTIQQLQAEIERLSKPYVPMTDDELVEELYNTPDYSYLPEDCGYERHYELTAIARYNEQRGVK